MPKINTFDSRDNFTQSDFTSLLDAVTGLSVLTGVYRSVQDWQLEKHMPMFDADMTAEQKTRAAAIVAKFKK